MLSVNLSAKAFWGSIIYVDRINYCTDVVQPFTVCIIVLV